MCFAKINKIFIVTLELWGILGQDYVHTLQHPCLLSRWRLRCDVNVTKLTLFNPNTALRDPAAKQYFKQQYQTTNYCHLQIKLV